MGVQLALYINSWYRTTPLSSYFQFLLREPLSSQAGFSGGSLVKNPPTNAGHTGLIAGSGRSPGEGNGNSLQYSSLENPTDLWGAWQAIVHGVTKRWTRLRAEHACTHILPGRSQNHQNYLLCLHHHHYQICFQVLVNIFSPFTILPSTSLYSHVSFKFLLLYMIFNNLSTGPA